MAYGFESSSLSSPSQQPSDASAKLVNDTINSTANGSQYRAPYNNVAPLAPGAAQQTDSSGSTTQSVPYSPGLYYGYGNNGSYDTGQYGVPPEQVNGTTSTPIVVAPWNPGATAGAGQSDTTASGGSQSDTTSSGTGQPPYSVSNAGSPGTQPGSEVNSGAKSGSGSGSGSAEANTGTVSPSGNGTAYPAYPAYPVNTGAGAAPYNFEATPPQPVQQLNPFSAFFLGGVGGVLHRPAIPALRWASGGLSRVRGNGTISRAVRSGATTFNEYLSQTPRMQKEALLADNTTHMPDAIEFRNLTIRQQVLSLTTRADRQAELGNADVERLFTAQERAVLTGTRQTTALNALRQSNQAQIDEVGARLPAIDGLPDATAAEKAKMVLARDVFLAQGDGTLNPELTRNGSVSRLLNSNRTTLVFADGQPGIPERSAPLFTDQELATIRRPYNGWAYQLTSRASGSESRYANFFSRDSTAEFIGGGATLFAGTLGGDIVDHVTGNSNSLHFSGYAVPLAVAASDSNPGRLWATGGVLAAQAALDMVFPDHGGTISRVTRINPLGATLIGLATVSTLGMERKARVVAVLGATAVNFATNLL